VLVAAAVGVVGRAALRRLSGGALRGQVVLVTGESRGLGFLLAREFAREGCRIAIGAHDADDLARARAGLEREGADVIALPCDVTDGALVEQLVERVTRHLGQIDVLVNHAGIVDVGQRHTMTTHDFQSALAEMFWGIVHPTLAVLPQMRARRSGRIVNVTALSGKVSRPHLLAYGSARFAAVGFSEDLRAAVAPDGIRVTTIVPGFLREGSDVNSAFRGRHDVEFAWLELGTRPPLVAVTAERAARAIVRAARSGDVAPIRQSLTIGRTVGARFQGRRGVQPAAS
jgi:NAD(P)-dependent dehydrogenase (short-subunit alcohol dehydrogenase family)